MTNQKTQSNLSQTDLELVGWCLFSKSGYCSWEAMHTLDPEKWADKNGSEVLKGMSKVWPDEVPFTFEPVYRKRTTGVQPTAPPSLEAAARAALAQMKAWSSECFDGDFDKAMENLEAALGVPVPHPFKEWSGGGPVRPHCASCGRSRNDPLHADGVMGHAEDQRQVREDSQGLGEPGRLSPNAGVKGGGNVQR